MGLVPVSVGIVDVVRIVRSVGFGNSVRLQALCLAQCNQVALARLFFLSILYMVAHGLRIQALAQCLGVMSS